MGRSARMKASEHCWAPLESLCEVAAAVTDAGEENDAKRQLQEEHGGLSTGGSRVGFDRGTARARDLPSRGIRVASSQPPAGSPHMMAGPAGAAQEVEAFCSVHDMIHAGIVAHGKCATLREIYSECQKRGRIAYRRSAGSRLITDNGHWKSQIRHALYTSNRFFRTGENDEYWAVADPYSDKGFQVTKVFVTDAEAAPEETVHCPEADAVSWGNGSTKVPLKEPSFEESQKPEVERVFDPLHKDQTNSPPTSLHRFKRRRSGSSVGDTGWAVCPILGVQIPRKPRTGLSRYASSGVSVPDMALSCHSDDDSAFRAPQALQPDAADGVASPLTARLLDENNFDSTVRDPKGAPYSHRQAVEEASQKRQKLNKHSENDGLPKSPKPQLAKPRNAQMLRQSTGQAPSMMALPNCHYTSLLNQMQHPLFPYGVYPGLGPQMMPDPAHSLVGFLPVSQDVYVRTILELISALKTTAEGALKGSKNGTT